MVTDFITRNSLTLHPEFADAFSAAGLDTLDALLQTSGEDNLHKPGLADWRQRLRIKLPGTQGAASEPRICYLKRYTQPPMGEQWNNRLAGHADCAAVEWHWLTELDRLGVPGPVPVAYGSKRKGMFEAASVVVTAAVPGEALERWVPAQLDAGGALDDRIARRRLSDAVADVVAKLHGNKLIHRDLYLAHLFLDPSTLASDSPTLTLIDLQRMICPKLRWRRWVVKDLAALNYSTPADAASFADRVRWFRRYRGVCRFSRADRAMLRAICVKTQRIAQHDAKRHVRLGRSQPTTDL